MLYTTRFAIAAGGLSTRRSTSSRESRIYDLHAQPMSRNRYRYRNRYCVHSRNRYRYRIIAIASVIAIAIA